MNYFKENIIFLRESKGEKQADTAAVLGLSRSTYANYEAGANLPKADIILKIIGHFNVDFNKLMEDDLSNVHLNKKSGEKKESENVHLNVHPNVHLNDINEVERLQLQLKERDSFIAVNQQLLNSKDQLIEQLQTNVKLLQNQIEQMKYDVEKRHETQSTQRKEEKAA